MLPLNVSSDPARLNTIRTQYQNFKPYPQFGQTPGTLGRNTLQGPGIVWGQASLSKEWPIFERIRFNLRFDVNNVYKYHNFNVPNAVYNATDPSTFGTFSGTRGSFSDIGTELARDYGVSSDVVAEEESRSR